VLYQLSYTPKSNDLEPPSHRYVAKLPPRRRSFRRGALVIADRNALSSLAAPHFSPQSSLGPPMAAPSAPLI
jgi:hypothetical protein